MTREQSISWLAFVCNVWVAHIKASRKTNEHKVLGELYDEQFEILDEMTELAVARDGDTKFPSIDIHIDDSVKVQALLKYGLSVLGDIRASLSPEADSDMLNVLETAKANIMRAAYKLELTLAGKQ